MKKGIKCVSVFQRSACDQIKSASQSVDVPERAEDGGADVTKQKVNQVLVMYELGVSCGVSGVSALWQCVSVLPLSCHMRKLHSLPEHFSESVPL